MISEDLSRGKHAVEKWIHKYFWLAPYIVLVVTVSLILQVMWR